MRGWSTLVFVIGCGGGSGVHGMDSGGSAAGPCTRAPETITANTTWTTDMCPICPDSSVAIGTLDGSTTPIVLTIEAGCHVEMRSQTSISVYPNGALQALGTSDAAVVIEPGHLQSAWSGIEIDTPSPLADTRLEHAMLQQTQTGLHIRNGSPVVISTTITGAMVDGITLENASTFDPRSADVTSTGNGRYGLVAPIASTDQLPAGDFSGNAKGGVHLIDSTVTHSLTWTDVKASYIVDSELDVAGAGSPVLTMQPGVTVEAPSVGVGGTAPGNLHALGSATAPVTFKTSGPVWINTMASGSELENVVIANADTALIVDSVPVLLQNLTATGQNYGISLRGTATLASGSTALTATGSIFSVEGSALAMTQLPVTGSSYTGDLWINGGTLAQSGTWHAFGPRYILNRPVDVHGTGTPVLTIEAGARIESFMGAGLTVGNFLQPGGLVAQGTAASPIVFTSTNATPGSWPGVVFDDDTTAGSLLDHVVVEYGGAGGTGTFSNIAIVANGGGPTVSNSTVWRSSSHGIYVSCNPQHTPPPITNITYGTGADANAGGDLVKSGCP